MFILLLYAGGLSKRCNSFDFPWKSRMLGGAACGQCYKMFKGKSDRDLGLYGMKTKYQETKMKRVLDAHLTTLSPAWKTCFYSICSYHPVLPFLLHPRHQLSCTWIWLRIWWRTLYSWSKSWEKKKPCSRWDWKIKNSRELAKHSTVVLQPGSKR